MITLPSRGALLLDKNNHEKTVIYIILSFEATVLHKPTSALLQEVFILRGNDIWWGFSFGLTPWGKSLFGDFCSTR